MTRICDDLVDDLGPMLHISGTQAAAAARVVERMCPDDTAAVLSALGLA